MATVAGQQDRKRGRWRVSSSHRPPAPRSNGTTSSSSAASRRSSRRSSSPGSTPTQALIAALALFAAGFAFRPLGALIFGVVGDKLGRKGAFLITVSLMGGATFLIGLLPTYAQAGSLGRSPADHPAHPPGHRARRRIWRRRDLRRRACARPTSAARRPAGSSRRPRSACSPRLLVIVATRTAIGEDAFAAWGWRIPFLVSAVLLAISVWMRAKLAESPRVRAAARGRRDRQGAAARSVRQLEAT